MHIETAAFKGKIDLCNIIQMSNMQNLFWNIPGSVIANSKQYDSIAIKIYECFEI